MLECSWILEFFGENLELWNSKSSLQYASIPPAELLLDHGVRVWSRHINSSTQSLSSIQFMVQSHGSTRSVSELFVDSGQWEAAYNLAANAEAATGRAAKRSAVPLVASATDADIASRAATLLESRLFNASRRSKGNSNKSEEDGGALHFDGVEGLKSLKDGFSWTVSYWDVGEEWWGWEDSGYDLRPDIYTFLPPTNT